LIGIKVSDEPVLAGSANESLTLPDRLEDSLEVHPELRINEPVEVLAIVEDEEVLPATGKARTEILQTRKPRLEVVEGMVAESLRPEPRARA
jgi:hypothetical protein